MADPHLNNLSVFVVRMKAGHQVAGIFAAEDVAGLWGLLDRHVDPGQCEYRQVGRGGLFVSGTTKAQWPVRELEGDENGHPDDVYPVDGAELNDEWNEAIDAEGAWLPMAKNPLDTKLRRLYGAPAT